MPLPNMDDTTDDYGAVAYTRRTVASWITTTQEVIFPQGLFEIGKSYDIQVQAHLGATMDSYRFAAPSAVTQQATGPITP